MNGRAAKRLRKEARRLSFGMPNVQLVAMRNNATQAINHPKTTRGIYLKLKRGLS